MEILDEVHEVVANAIAHLGTVRHVAWVAAGGSNGGFYPAHYFMTHEAKTVSSQMFTSNEFVMAPPAYLGPDTVAVICSMRGTPETCKAAQVAREHGAATIGLYVQESLLTQTCDQLIAYESIALDESRTERVNSSVGLALAMELVDQTEGYAHMPQAKAAFEQVDGLYRKAVERMTPLAADWAKQNKDEHVIYVMGSGPAYGSAYIFSICNIEEMLQIASPTINSCEFFHGPFEILTKQTSVFQLLSVGRTRAADERAVRFLKRYGGQKVYVLDGLDLGLGELDPSVAEYFNHVLFSPVLNNVYMRALSAQTGKDYNTRTYMWQVAY